MLKKNSSSLGKSHNWVIHKILSKHFRDNISYIQGKVLDIGCGEKPYLSLLEKIKPKKYIGINLPTDGYCKKMIDVFADATNLPFKDNAFDTIVSFQVLEHVPEPKSMLQEANRTLKQGGYLYASTPFIWPIHEAPNDYYRFTIYGLRYLFEKTGFEVVGIEANTGLWITMALRLNYFLLKIYKKFFLGRPFLRGIFWITQQLAELLDKIYKIEDATSTYTIIARKKIS